MNRLGSDELNQSPSVFTRRCSTIAMVVLAFSIAFLAANRREFQVRWWRYRLSHGIVHLPDRSAGGKDFAMTDALDALHEMRKLGADQQARERLLELMRDPRSDVRSGAFLVLTQMDFSAIPALSELDRIAGDPGLPPEIQRDARACAESIRGWARTNFVREPDTP